MRHLKTKVAHSHRRAGGFSAACSGAGPLPRRRVIRVHIPARASAWSAGEFSLPPPARSFEHRPGAHRVPLRLRSAIDAEHLENLPRGDFLDAADRFQHNRPGVFLGSFLGCFHLIRSGLSGQVPRLPRSESARRLGPKLVAVSGQFPQVDLLDFDRPETPIAGFVLRAPLKIAHARHWRYDVR